MATTNKVEKTLGEQMTDLLLRNPKNYDVIFTVGPGKIKVEAVRFILKAASPVFEKVFEGKWENAVGKEGEEIQLPNIDPTAFQVFVNLLILDAWSVDSINALNLSPGNLLNVLGLCRRYKITKAVRNLEDAVDGFIQSFEKYKDTGEFLKLSQENLETIFSCENLPLEEKEIFEYACRWADNQCTIKDLEPTGENYRKVLGGCLFEIRFPTMSVAEFTTVGLFKKNILKGDEKLAIYEYIGLSVDEKTRYDKTHLRFKSNPRKSFKCSVLSLPKKTQISKEDELPRISQHDCKESGGLSQELWKESDLSNLLRSSNKPYGSSRSGQTVPAISSRPQKSGIVETSYYRPEETGDSIPKTSNYNFDWGVALSLLESSTPGDRVTPNAGTEEYLQRESGSKVSLDMESANNLKDDTMIECPHCTLLNPKHRVVCDCCQKRIKNIPE